MSHTLVPSYKRTRDCLTRFITSSFQLHQTSFNSRAVCAEGLCWYLKFQLFKAIYLRLQNSYFSLYGRSRCSPRIHFRKSFIFIRNSFAVFFRLSTDGREDENEMWERFLVEISRARRKQRSNSEIFGLTTLRHVKECSNFIFVTPDCSTLSSLSFSLVAETDSTRSASGFDIFVFNDEKQDVERAKSEVLKTENAPESRLLTQFLSYILSQN